MRRLNRRAPAISQKQPQPRILLHLEEQSQGKDLTQPSLRKLLSRKLLARRQARGGFQGDITFVPWHGTFGSLTLRWGEGRLKALPPSGRKRRFGVAYEDYSHLLRRVRLCRGPLAIPPGGGRGRGGSGTAFPHFRPALKVSALVRRGPSGRGDSCRVPSGLVLL